MFILPPTSSSTLCGHQQHIVHLPALLVTGLPSVARNARAPYNGLSGDPVSCHRSCGLHLYQYPTTHYLGNYPIQSSTEPASQRASPFFPPLWSITNRTFSQPSWAPGSRDTTPSLGPGRLCKVLTGVCTAAYSPNLLTIRPALSPRWSRDRPKWCPTDGLSGARAFRVVLLAQALHIRRDFLAQPGHVEKPKSGPWR